MNNERLRERYKLCYDGWFYAVQRIDLLVISICGAGVYVVLETLKYVVDKTPVVQKYLDNLWMIKLSGLLFLASIIVNFVSQLTGKKSNYHEMLWCDEKLECDDPPTVEQKKLMTKYDTDAGRYSKITGRLNTVSTLIMCGGLFALLAFFLITF